MPEYEAADVELSEDAAFYWDAFFDIQSGIVRLIGDGLLKPITWDDFLAYQKTTKFPLHDYEIDVLKAMDRAYLRFMSEAIDEARQRITEEAARKNG